MTLHYDYFSGHSITVETSLKKSLAAYIIKYNRVKIGITNNPERKAKEHDENGSWKRMFVKFYTTSDKNVSEVVNIIAAHHWDQVENEISGEGGPKGCAPYYLYVLVA